MLDNALEALAATGGSALVTAMVTDAWESVRAAFARLLGRGDPVRTATAEKRLEQSRQEMGDLSGEELERASAEQEAAWRVRLGDLLEELPDAAHELRALIDQMQLSEPRPGGIVQNVAGSGRAQQAVQGHGVQVNTFGNQGDARGSR
jgi:hypothetical protein